MREFMQDGLRDLLRYVVWMKMAFERALEDDDAVGQRVGGTRAFGQWRADIEAKQVVTGTDIASSAVGGGGLAFDDDGNVIERTAHLGRERGNSAMDEAAEASAIHLPMIYRQRPGCTYAPHVHSR